MAPTNFAITRKVNPEGALPLTHAQLWKGLQLRSRDPNGFHPTPVTLTEISEDDGKGKFTRKVIFEGHPPLVEEVKEYSDAIVSMTREGTDRCITSIISWDEDDNLLLTFSFAGGIPLKGVIADALTATQVNKLVGTAVDKTLLKIRQLVKDGVI